MGVVMPPEERKSITPAVEGTHALACGLHTWRRDCHGSLRGDLLEEEETAFLLIPADPVLVLQKLRVGPTTWRLVCHPATLLLRCSKGRPTGPSFWWSMTTPT